jgi:hypothetical protein
MLHVLRSTRAGNTWRRALVTTSFDCGTWPRSGIADWPGFYRSVSPVEECACCGGAGCSRCRKGRAAGARREAEELVEGRVMQQRMLCNTAVWTMCCSRVSKMRQSSFATTSSQNVRRICALTLHAARSVQTRCSYPSSPLRIISSRWFFSGDGELQQGV